MKGWREQGRLIKHRNDKQKERERKKEREGEKRAGGRWVQTREEAAQQAKLFLLFLFSLERFFVQCDIEKEKLRTDAK